MAGTVTASVVKNDTTSPPQFQNSAGTEIGTLCRAWVNFNGTNGSIRSSFNVSSVTVVSTGVYTVNLANAMVDTNYAVQVTNQQNATANTSANTAGPTSTSTVTVTHFEVGSVSYPATNTAISVSVFR